MSKLLSDSPSCSLVKNHEINGRIDAAYYASKYLHLDDQLSDLPKTEIFRLGDLLKSPRRVLYQNTKTFDSHEAPPSSLPFISGVDLDGDIMGIKWDRVKYVENWMAEKYPKGKLFSGALLIKVKGPNQHTVYVSKNEKIALVSGTVFFSGVKSCNPYYLTCYLSSKTGVEWRSRLRTNTTVEFIGNEELRNVPVYLPDEKVQSYVGAKLEIAERCRNKANIITQELNLIIDDLFNYPSDLNDKIKHNFVDTSDLTQERMDAWFYKKSFMDLSRWILLRDEYENITDISNLMIKKRDYDFSYKSKINYVEISSIDINSSIITPTEHDVNKLPSRAQKPLCYGDLIISTVQAASKCLSVIPKHFDGSIGSSAFAILRTSDVVDAYFLEAMLRHDVCTSQIIRWNTGTIFSAVAQDVFEKIKIPKVDKNIRQQIGLKAKRRADLLYKSKSLISEAKFDVEALIEGKLDTDTILSGKLNAPTWEDIEKELEGI